MLIAMRHPAISRCRFANEHALRHPELGKLEHDDTTQRLTRLKSEAAAEQQLLVRSLTPAAAEKIQQAHIIT